MNNCRLALGSTGRQCGVQSNERRKPSRPHSGNQAATPLSAESARRRPPGTVERGVLVPLRPRSTRWADRGNSPQGGAQGLLGRTALGANEMPGTGATLLKTHPVVRWGGKGGRERFTDWRPSMAVRQSIESRFWTKVDKGDDLFGCWRWRDSYARNREAVKARMREYRAKKRGAPGRKDEQ